MSETRHDAEIHRREVVERRDVVESRDAYGPAPGGDPRASMGWIWLIPLLLVVLVVVWFVLSRGEPQRPLENVEITVPQLEAPVVREERRIEVEVPAGGGEAAPQSPAQPATPQ